MSEDNILKFVLPNNLRVLIKPINDTKIITVNLAINVSAFDERNCIGMRNLIQEILLETSNLYNNELIDDGISCMVTHDLVYLSVYSLDKFYDNYIDKVASLLINFETNIDRVDISKVKDKILRCLSKEKRPWDEAHELFLRAFYQRHPYAQPITGGKETIERLDKKTILDFFNKYYTSNNIVISLVGDVDAIKGSEQINQRFKSLKANYGSCNGKKGNIKLKIPKKPINVVERKGTCGQTWVVVGYPMAGIKDDGNLTGNLIHLILDIWVCDEIRFKRKLAYFAFARYADFADLGHMVCIAGVPSNLAIETKNIMLMLFKKLTINLLSDQELEVYKRKWKGLFLWGMERPQEQAQIISTYQHFNIETTPFDSLLMIEQSNPQAIRRTANKYFDGNYVSIMMEL